MSVKEHNGRIMGIYQQIRLSEIVAPDLGLDPQKFMELLGKAGVKIEPDEAEIMLDASRVYVYENGKGSVKPDLQVVE
jgi:hypothetical protein